MNTENRINFPIPNSTLIVKGFKDPFFGFRASPGDMIVENINNAPRSRFLNFERIDNIPGNMPFKGLEAKRFIAYGVKTENEYLITVTDEGILFETGGEIVAKNRTMMGENVQRIVVYYHDFCKLTHGEISEFLRRFIIEELRYEKVFSN